MSTNNKVSKKRHVEHVVSVPKESLCDNSTDVEVAPDASELHVRLRDTLDCLPPELLKLVGETLLLPYRYKWVQRSGYFNVHNDGTTVQFFKNHLSAATAVPYFPKPNADTSDRKYVADWVVCRGASSSDSVVWAGVCNPESL